MARRRSFMLAGLSAVAIAAATRPKRAFGFESAKSLEDLSDLEIFTRIRCSPPGTVTTWWYSGHMLARQGEDPATPVLSIIGASQSRITLSDDGSVMYDLVEAGYYGDVNTRQVADAAITNPLTGQLMTPEHYLSRQKLRFLPNLTVSPANPISPSVEFTGRITQPDVKGDKVWMAEELFVKLPSRGEQAPPIANSLANFEANISDVIRGGSFVPATFEYTTWNSFRPWMNMGEKSGAIMMRLNSVKLRSWKELPSDLTTRIDADHPTTFPLS